MIPSSIDFFPWKERIQKSFRSFYGLFPLFTAQAYTPVAFLWYGLSITKCKTMSMCQSCTYVHDNVRQPRRVLNGKHANMSFNITCHALAVKFHSSSFCIVWNTWPKTRPKSNFWYFILQYFVKMSANSFGHCFITLYVFKGVHKWC